MKGKPNPRRAELKALSMQVRPLVKAGAFENVNAAVLHIYSQQTGFSDWKTFKGWLDAGQAVRKGESGFPIWAKPRHMKAEGAMAGDLGAIAALNGIEPQGPEFFPVCYLFHAGQVEQSQKAAA